MAKFYEKFWEGDAEELGDFGLKWPKLSTLIPKENGVAVLDFGCGKGDIIGAMKELNPNAKYSGVDVSETAIEYATKKYPDAFFARIEDGGQLPFANDSFDFIFSSEVVEHIYDAENAFQELARVLKPGGKVLITCPYHGFIKNLAIVLLGFDKHFDVTGAHVRFFSKKSLSRCLLGAGITPIFWTSYGRFQPVQSSMVVIAEKK